MFRHTITNCAAREDSHARALTPRTMAEQGGGSAHLGGDEDNEDVSETLIADHSSVNGQSESNCRTTDVMRVRRQVVVRRWTKPQNSLPSTRATWGGKW
jgi:hypothetical protein